MDFSETRPWPGATTAQQRRNMRGQLDVIKRLRQTEAPQRRSLEPSGLPRAGKTISAVVDKLLAGGTFVNESRRAQEIRTGSVGVVVPFGGGGSASLDGLRRCLGALGRAVRPGDKIVVSVRGSPADALRLCEELGVACVESTSGGLRWNMSAARNAGWLWLDSHMDCQHVAFVDADVEVPESYLQRLAHEAYKRPGMVLTPYVVDKGEDAARSARIASGMSMYPIGALQIGRGFPESFVGWGHEDIALLHVLKEQHDVPTVPLPDVVAIHTAHPARVGEEQRREDSETNRRHYCTIVEQLDAGGEVRLNHHGEFGAYTELFVP